MAKKYKQAIEDIKSLNKLFESVRVLAEAVSESDKIEVAVEAAQSKKKQIVDEIEALKKNKEQELSKINDLAAELVVAQDKTSGIVASAKKDAEAVILEANKKKGEILSYAEDQRLALELLVKKAKEEELAVKSSISQKMKELSDLEAKIESTKESFRALVK